jgi:CRISPR-associated protein Cas2
MFVVVSYDVSTTDPKGSRRLNRVAKACKDYGQRVQYSVFECIVDPAQWAVLKQRLIDEIDQKLDSLRFYYLGSNWRRRVEHIGAKETIDQEGPLIV